MSRPGRRTGARRGGGEQALTVIWWGEVPAQVIASDGATTSRAEMPERFQKAIDAIAMREGLIGTDDYLARWSRRARPFEGDPASVVRDEIARLDAQFPPSRLADLIAGRSPAFDPQITVPEDATT